MQLLVGRINDLRLAQSFVDYLLAQQISAYFENDTQHIAIFVRQEQHLELARNEFVRFVEQPFHKRYMAASWQRIGPSPVTVDYSGQSHSFLYQLWVQSGPVTLLLMFAALLGYGAVMLLGGNQLQDWLGLPSGAEQLHQVWRFVTPGLLHFSAIQLLFSLLWIWYFGSKIEQLSRSWRLFSLWLLATLFANFVLYSLKLPVATGYSAATYALMGYLFIAGLRHKQQYVPHALCGFLLFFMLTSLFGVLGDPVIGITELVGFAVGTLQQLMERRRFREEP